MNQLSHQQFIHRLNSQDQDKRAHHVATTAQPSDHRAQRRHALPPRRRRLLLPRGGEGVRVQRRVAGLGELERQPQGLRAREAAPRPAGRIEEEAGQGDGGGGVVRAGLLGRRGLRCLRGGGLLVR